MPTDVVPIFQAVLPNGKVLMWDSVGDGPTESYTDLLHPRIDLGSRHQFLRSERRSGLQHLLRRLCAARKRQRPW